MAATERERKVMQMCEDVYVMEEHLNAIQIIFEDLGKNFHEQDEASDKIEKEVKDAMESLNTTRGLLDDAQQYKKSAEKKNCVIRLMAVGGPILIIILIIFFVYTALRT